MHNGVLLMGGAAVARAALHARRRLEARRHVLDQRVPDVLALEPGDDASSGSTHRKEHPDWCKHLPVHLVGAAPLRHDPRRHDLREVRRGRLAHAGRDRDPRRRLLPRSSGTTRLVVRAIRSLDDELPCPFEDESLRRAARPGAALGPVVRDGRHARSLEHHGARDPDHDKPVAILFVGGYGGLGRHALLTLLRMFPRHFSGVVFVSVAVVDSESFKGADQIAALEARTRENLLKYERFAQSLGLAAASAFAIGHRGRRRGREDRDRSDAPLSRGPLRRRPAHLREDTLWNRLLHNETAFMIQQRLQRRGLPMIVLPVRLDLKARRTIPAQKKMAA